MSYGSWKQYRPFARGHSLFRKVPLFIAVTYAVVSGLWILFSDRALSHIAGTYSSYQILQTYKGWLFVAASSLLIFLLLRGAWNGILAAYREALESERRLQLALTAAAGGTWELDLTGNTEELTHISDELIHRLGLPPGQGLTMEELRGRIHPDDAKENDRALRQAISSCGEQPYDVRYRVRCEDGVYRWVRARGNVVAAADGRPQRMVGVAFDIDERVKSEQKLAQLLRYDPATGLPKQSKFLADIDSMLAEASAERWVAVVQLRLLDLDRLIGDAETAEDAQLVRLIGDRLHGLPDMLVGRITSDVFALATSPASSPLAAQRLVRDVLADLREPVPTEGGSVKLRIQAGGTVVHPHAETSIGLLRNSGHALELAGRNADTDIRWLDEELSAEISVRANRIRGLESAVSRGEIECFYQPLIDLATGTTSGFEALARWRSAGEGLLPPSSFIALAEEIGKIAEIGEEVLRQACRAAASWPAPFPFVAVNVSPRQLEDPAFPGVVARTLKETGLPAERLELEITENALPSDETAALHLIVALRDLGVNVAIDDFGTGYSSLSLLSRVPFTRLKIDRSFVSGGANAHQNAIIIDTIVNLAHNLGLALTAEGVETAEQAERLVAKGVDLAQGFYFSEPVAAPRSREFIGRIWPIGPAQPDKQSALRLVR